MSEEKKIVELNDEELEKVSGGDIVCDDDGNPLYYAGYYEYGILEFVDLTTGRMYLKCEETNKIMEVINHNEREVIQEIRKQ